MKKTFPLSAPGKAAARVVESIKHDIRKYVNRERGKTLPAGFDLWEFNCRAGPNATTAVSKPLKEIGAAIDEVATAGEAGVYVEIIAVPGHRVPRAAVIPPVNPEPPIDLVPPSS